MDVLDYYCNNMILLQTIYCIPGTMSQTILEFAAVNSVFTEGLGLNLLTTCVMRFSINIFDIVPKIVIPNADHEHQTYIQAIGTR